jgi:hypothetical protein
MGLRVERKFGQKIHFFNKLTGEYVGSIKTINTRSSQVINFLSSFTVKREELLSPEERRRMMSGGK